MYSKMHDCLCIKYFLIQKHTNILMQYQLMLLQFLALLLVLILTKINGMWIKYEIYRLGPGMSHDNTYKQLIREKVAACQKRNV